MENKIGYAYISLEEYKKLIEDLKTLEICYDELKEKNAKTIREYESIEKTIFEKIYDNNKYYLKNYDGVGEYYHTQLVIVFQEYGYISLDKINDLIQKLVKKYENEEGSKKENE